MLKLPDNWDEMSLMERYRFLYTGEGLQDLLDTVEELRREGINIPGFGAYFLGTPFPPIDE